ncbi:hypothetical protein MG293_006746 [Ovis ammon polii]|uniref:Uncharacterized protein n=1 Tax=Ovis ammon polii TaxID=230172 RepID=A0AAD4UFY5_OVIAM|nr:hypothetical protein MG293_006746 [Ovis ammon polii]
MNSESFKLCSAPKLKMSFCCRLTDIAPESSELVLSPCQWKSLQEVREGDLLLLCGPGREAEHCGNTVDGQPDPGAEQIPARSTKSKTVVLESKVLQFPVSLLGNSSKIQLMQSSAERSIVKILKKKIDFLLEWTLVTPNSESFHKQSVLTTDPQDANQGTPFQTSNLTFSLKEKKKA